MRHRRIPRLFAAIAPLGLVASLVLGCAETLRPCDQSSYPIIERSALLKEVDQAEIRREYLKTVDASSLPEAPRKGVEEWIDKEIRELNSKMLPGDRIYFYRYEKCCGWYREGYVAVRGHCIVAEINTREDM